LIYTGSFKPVRKITGIFNRIVKWPTSLGVNRKAG
jgi:hypothetical protein